MALLDAPTATVQDIAKTSRVPRAKLYEVLESLNRKGLVDILPETPQRFRANPLTALYDTRVEELRSQEAELKRSVGDLMVQLVPPAPTGSEEVGRDFVHLLHGRTHYPVLLRQQVVAAQRSLLLVGDRLLLARLALYEDATRQLALVAQKVAVRILVPENAVDVVEGRRVRMDELADRIRRAPLVLGDASVLVRDQQEYVVTRFVPNDLHPSRGSDRVEVGRDSDVAALWHRLAEAVWERAAPWKPA